jgi:hypothetical protein
MVNVSFQIEKEKEKKNGILKDTYAYEIIS